MLGIFEASDAAFCSGEAQNHTKDTGQVEGFTFVWKNELYAFKINTTDQLISLQKSPQ